MLPLDKVIDKVVGLGVPGLVLIIAIEATGLAGGAAIVAALSFLGGPFGMIGGFAALALILLISQAIAKYGISKIVEGVVHGLEKKGIARDEIKRKVNAYPISKDLKRKLSEYLAGVA